VLLDTTLARRAVLLAKPLSYMNLSGEPVSELCAVRGISPVELLVVHDELDLPFGRLKLKRGGGSAGHRGLASIAASLDTSEFHRLRVGIGRPPTGREVADFVLEAFDGEEVAALPSLLERAADACALWLELGIEAAMGRVNADVDRGQAGPDPAPDPAAPGSRTP